MLDRPENGERAVLIHLDIASDQSPEDPAEFLELVRSAGVETVALIRGSRAKPSSRLFIGEGKLEEIREAVVAHEAEVALFNHSLSPSQERNLERELKCRVIDRTGVILDIFAQRARTHEGKLQVELAQLEHLSTRLIRGWTHLERQKGGIGLRGPGETQLETDRRLLRNRIQAIHRRLDKVRKQREQGRRARKRAEMPAISLVGYTNAGKSTLFNRLTDAAVYAADQLFATLDPTLRRLELPDVGTAVLADTVGFIRHLPHKLVEAFRATLEETTQATLLLHVVDSHSEERDGNIEQVHLVLAEIGADEIPMLQVFNKIDLIEGFAPRLDRDESGVPQRVWLSAQTGQGIDLLLDAISERLANDLMQGDIRLTPRDGQMRAQLYKLHAVVQETALESGDMLLEVRLPMRDWNQMLHRLGRKSAEFLIDTTDQLS